MKTYDLLTNNYNTDWKMITIQIGSNDQCAACGDEAQYVTADAYGSYVEAAIERIKSEIPKTVVNLCKYNELRQSYLFLTIELIKKKTSGHI